VTGEIKGGRQISRSFRAIHLESDDKIMREVDEEDNDRDKIDNSSRSRVIGV
jgi:hypothetical protein